jgi:hypothetical protein
MLLYLTCWLYGIRYNMGKVAKAVAAGTAEKYEEQAQQFSNMGGSGSGGKKRSRKESGGVGEDSAPNDDYWAMLNGSSAGSKMTATATAPVASVATEISPQPLAPPAAVSVPEIEVCELSGGAAAKTGVVEDEKMLDVEVSTASATPCEEGRAAKAARVE